MLESLDGETVRGRQDMTTLERLRELLTIADLATPGPWVVQGRFAGSKTGIYQERSLPDSPVFICQSEPVKAEANRSERIANFKFICESRKSMVPMSKALIVAVEALEELCLWNPDVDQHVRNDALKQINTLIGGGE